VITFGKFAEGQSSPAAGCRQIGRRYSVQERSVSKVCSIEHRRYLGNLANWHGFGGGQSAGSPVAMA